MAEVQEVLKQMSDRISQTNRLIRLDTPLGPDVLLAHRVLARERLGRTYDYTVDLLSLRSNIELKQLIAQPVTLWIKQDGREHFPVHGYVHTAKKLGGDGQFSAYQLSFAPWLHFLKFRRDARIWQEKGADDILAEVFNGHAQARGKFRLELSQAVQSRSYCTQYETDWHFAMRIMEEEGWYGYHEQQADGQGHVFVVTDTVRKLPPLGSAAIEFHRAGTDDEVGKVMQWGASRSLLSNRLATTTYDYKSPAYDKETYVPADAGHGTLPEQLEVYEYTGAYTYPEQERGDKLSRIRVEEWESRAKRFYGTSGVRRLPAGYWFTLDKHPAHANDSEDDRQFVVVAVEWAIENNLPLSQNLQEFPGSLKEQLHAFRQQAGLAPTLAGSANERTGHCYNRFEVQRRKVEFRSPLEHSKPLMHPQTATVVGPDTEEVFTDKLNRVKVRFHWDRINPGNEGASCWVRVSYPNAGDDWGGVHVPRIKQEVIVTYLDGDLDKPVITGRLYNGAQTPQWHTDGRMSGYKSKEYKGAGFNQLVMDDSTGQNRVQLYSSSSHAQLNLGYLVGQQGNSRNAFYGSGFALNTEAYGAITANQGLYVSTFAHPGANGVQLDVREAREQLAAGHGLTKALSETGAKAGAQALAAQDTLLQFTEATQDSYSGTGQQQANRFKEPVLLLGSPAGIGLTTPKSSHIHSGENVTVSTGADINLATGKSLVASSKESVSLFAYNAGMKLIAAKGKVDIQAQSDDLDIIAEKVLRLISTSDRIELWAKKEIILGADGSAIKINGAGITDFTNGERISHNADFSLPGPKNLPFQMPEIPKTICLECLLKRANMRSAFINKGSQS